MADLIAINGADEALAALPAQFVGKPNAEALWKALASPVTDYEALLQWLQTAYTLDAGAGVQLDALGQILGQPRAGGPYPVGESDADYLRKLRAAVLRNRSMGNAPDLIAMVRALLSTKIISVQVSDFPAAAFKIAAYVSSALTASEEAALSEFCADARAAGVGLIGLAWYTSPVFGFVPSSNPPVQGYGDGNPAHPGGAWANYIYP